MKFNRLQEIASMEALKSTCNNKHGCIIARNTQIYAKGHNIGERSKILGIFDYSIHAEISAANEFINTYIHPNANKYKGTNGTLYNLKGFVVLCVRISGKNIFTNSSPCSMCLQRLKQLGFKKIAFTNNCGIIEMHNINTYKTDHYSKLQRRVMNMNPQHKYLPKLYNFQIQI